MTKRQEDWEKAQEKRDETANDLNFYLLISGLSFKRVDDTIHYQLNSKNGKNIPFIFMYKDSGGFYLKVPKEFLDNPVTYLDHLIKENYYSIIVDGENREYTVPISFMTIKKYWKWKMETSEGNKNRMQFRSLIGRMTYRRPLEGSAFSPCLVDELNKLLS
jgi:hypothetical protein